MSTRQSRAAHNELEKNRRANLRGYLDNLKMVLPAETVDSSRDTTLSLLTRARNYIREVKAQKDALLQQRNRMLEEQARLQTEVDSAMEESCDITSAAVANLMPLMCSTTNMELKPIGSTDCSAFSPASNTSSTLASQQFPLQFLVNPQPSPILNTNLLFQQHQQQPLSMESLMLQGLLPLLPLLYPYTCSALQQGC